MKKRILKYSIVSALLVTTILSVVILLKHNVEAQGESRIFIAQRTAISSPHSLIGHQSHQAVLVVPLRSDGMIWDGDVTWTASQPVEVVVWHLYNTSNIDPEALKEHGQPTIAQLPDGSGRYVALTFYKVESNTPVPSGSIHFVGSALEFHNKEGKPFTVTYSVKAVAFQPRE